MKKMKRIEFVIIATAKTIISQTKRRPKLGTMHARERDVACARARPREGESEWDNLFTRIIIIIITIAIQIQRASVIRRKTEKEMHRE